MVWAVPTRTFRAKRGACGWWHPSQDMVTPGFLHVFIPTDYCSCCLCLVPTFKAPWPSYWSSISLAFLPLAEAAWIVQKDFWILRACKGKPRPIPFSLPLGLDEQENSNCCAQKPSLSNLLELVHAQRLEPSSALFIGSWIKEPESHQRQFPRTFRVYAWGTTAIKISSCSQHDVSTQCLVTVFCLSPKY